VWEPLGLVKVGTAAEERPVGRPVGLVRVSLGRGTTEWLVGAGAASIRTPAESRAATRKDLKLILRDGTLMLPLNES